MQYAVEFPLFEHLLSKRPTIRMFHYLNLLLRERSTLYYRYPNMKLILYTSRAKRHRIKYISNIVSTNEITELRRILIIKKRSYKRNYKIHKYKHSPILISIFNRFFHSAHPSFVSS